MSLPAQDVKNAARMIAKGKTLAEAAAKYAGGNVERLRALLPATTLIESRYVTVVTTTFACGKYVTGTPEAPEIKSKGTEIEGTAVVKLAATPEALLAVLESLTSHQYIIPDYPPAMINGKPFEIFSQKKADYKTGVVEGDGKRGLSLNKVDWAFGGWRVLDRDVDEHTPEQYRGTLFDWIIEANCIIPGLLEAPVVFWPSSKTRVPGSGTTLNGHLWVDCSAGGVEQTNAMRSWLRLRAHELGMSWSKPRVARATGLPMRGKGVQCTIFDTAVWTIHRQFYAGAPDLHIKGIELLQPQGRASNGIPLDLRVAIPAPTPEAVRAYGAALNYQASTDQHGGIKLEADDLLPEHMVELQTGAMTVGEFAKWAKAGDKHRCQTIFRESSSWNGIIRLMPDGRVMHHDNGTGETNYYRPVLVGEVMPEGEPEGPSEAALALAKAIESHFAVHKLTIPVDASVIERCIKGAFWDGSSSKLRLLDEHGSLNQYTGADACKALARWFGPSCDVSPVAALSNTLTKPEIKALMIMPVVKVLDYIKDHNQRTKVEWSVDMFADKDVFVIEETSVRITLRYRPKLLPSFWENALVVTDFKQHFPEFDEFIGLLLNARFAADRKKAYLWIMASSDWGKSLLKSVLVEIGLAVCLSVQEIEAAFEGKPVGRKALDFVHAWALVVEEFKTVKAELKQLESSMDLTPKFEFSQTVNLFTKLFLSAEAVASLTGDQGVEDQFANRMSLFKKVPQPKLNDRQMFIALGKDKYRRALSHYVTQRLREGVARMLALGEESAATVADAAVTDFHAKHGISNYYATITQRVPEVAVEFVAWLETDLQGKRFLREGMGKVVITHASKAFSDYVKACCAAGEAPVMLRRSADVLACVGEYGAHKIGENKSVKGVKLHTPSGREWPEMPKVTEKVTG